MELSLLGMQQEMKELPFFQKALSRVNERVALLSKGMK